MSAATRTAERGRRSRRAGARFRGSTSFLRDGQSLNFAVPMRYAMGLLGDRLVENERSRRSSPRRGAGPRATSSGRFGRTSSSPSKHVDG